MLNVIILLNPDDSYSVKLSAGEESLIIPITYDQSEALQDMGVLVYEV